MDRYYSSVKCSFKPRRCKIYHGRIRVEVFFAESENLDYTMLKKFVSAEELERSARLQSIDDRCTYVCCHAILRLLLARRLNKSPLNIVFERGYQNKPYLQGNPLYFNISHTNKAFGISVSDAYTGIDIESRNRLMRPELIMDSAFSINEKSFIYEDKNQEKERLMILWTRKEAFLKAIGRGLTKNMNQIEVYGSQNYIEGSIIPETHDILISDEHFLYTISVSDHFLSVASPGEADLNLTVINESNYLYTLIDLLNHTDKAAQTRDVFLKPYL